MASTPETADSADKSDEGKLPSHWKLLLALCTTVNIAISGGISYFGYSKAEEINKTNKDAEGKLASINSINELSYTLFARSAERDFDETIGNSPGTERKGEETELERAQIRFDIDKLTEPEKSISGEKHPIKHLMQGYLLQTEHRNEEAIKEYNEYKKNSPTKNLLLGTALARTKHLSEAIELNNKIIYAIGIRPSNRMRAKAQMNNGNIMRMQGHIDDALALYKAAINTDKTLYLAHYNLAALLAAKDDLNGAITELCNYVSFGNDQIQNDIIDDADSDFATIRKSLGQNWERALNSKLSECRYPK